MAICLTERDLNLLQTLHTARYMTTEQIQMLFFPGQGGVYGPLKSCRLRLKQLSEAKLVRRIDPWVKRGHNVSYIYALDKAGAQTLEQEFGLTIVDYDWKPKSNEDNLSFMKHTLISNDMHIVVIRSCPGAGVELEMWWDERVIRGEKPDYVTVTDPKTKKEDKTAVIPDNGFILAKDSKRSLYLLENDLRTVTIEARNWESRSWEKKVLAYEAYQNTEALALRYGLSGMARILTATTSEARLETMKQATERVGGNRNFWFTTFQTASAPNINYFCSPIWHVAGRSGLHALL